MSKQVNIYDDCALLLVKKWLDIFLDITFINQILAIFHVSKLIIDIDDWQNQNWKHWREIQWGILRTQPWRKICGCTYKQNVRAPLRNVTCLLCANKTLSFIKHNFLYLVPIQLENFRLECSEFLTLCNRLLNNILCYEMPHL